MDTTTSSGGEGTWAFEMFAAIFWLAGVATLAFATASCSSCSPCENNVKQEVASPTTKRAVVFSRECGATTGFSSQLSILDAQQTLPDEGGNVVVLDGKDMIREVRWNDGKTLVVEIVGSPEVFKREEAFDGVKIEYRTVEPVASETAAP